MEWVMHTVLSFRQFSLSVNSIYLPTFGDTNSKAAYQPIFSTACFVFSKTELLKSC